LLTTNSEGSFMGIVDRYKMYREASRGLIQSVFAARKGESSKICISVGWRMSDEEYLAKVEEGLKMAQDFRPEIILHFSGHDTHRDDYGSRGLSEDFFIELARKMKEFSAKISSGKYVLIDGGSANREVTEYIFPRIIDVLRTSSR